MKQLSEYKSWKLDKIEAVMKDESCGLMLQVIQQRLGAKSPITTRALLDDMIEQGRVKRRNITISDESPIYLYTLVPASKVTGELPKQGENGNSPEQHDHTSNGNSLEQTTKQTSGNSLDVSPQNKDGNSLKIEKTG